MDTRAHGLVVLHAADGLLTGRVLALSGDLCIGRREQEGVGLVIDDKLLSSRHATLARARSGWTLLDHGSKNGSFVDGERVASERRVREGSIIRLGLHLFELSDEASEPGFIDETAAGDDSVALCGQSFALRRAVEAMHQLVEERGHALLIGEHGTGKEAAARRLHERWRRPGAFIRASATELERAKIAGDFGSADDLALGKRAAGGTLLLTGIDALSLAKQTELVAALQRGDLADVVVIATSEVDLEPLVEDGSFHRNLLALFSRRMHLPALRARKSDLAFLCRRVWQKLAPGRTLDFSVTCLEKLLLYEWPMNVRELEALMRRLARSAEITTLRSAHLPRAIRDRLRQPPLDQLRASAVTVQLAPSRDELAALLERFGGNLTALAQYYARDKRQVLRWLKRHDLRAADPREDS